MFIVSNRIGDLSSPTQTGGLAVAVAETFKNFDGVWLGWDGVSDRDDLKDAEETVAHTGSVETVGVPLAGDDYGDHYYGYANSVLWPLFHYRADLVDYQARYYEAYLKVNRQLGEAVMSRLKPDDMVWIHDYQLIPLGHFLRKRGCQNCVGFFLHTPFPPPEVLAASPDHKRTVNELLEYDLVGFQTHTDLANFHRYLETNGLGTVAEDNTIRTDSRVLASGRFPICIDVEDFRKMAVRPNDQVEFDRMRRRLLNRKRIVGVDRLDYSKGIPERFEAFGKLFSQHPEMERAVSLLQISPPTREALSAYVEIREETERLAGAINGQFSDFNWTPIQYIHRQVARDMLAAIFRASDIALVTPLRDGMNLVAKEFVAAQDFDDPGVLVLSKFAGAAEEMTNALIVNPHDTDDVARTIYRALVMPVEERRERHRNLHKGITDFTVKHWADAFLRALKCDEGKTEPAEPPSNDKTIPLPEHGTAASSSRSRMPWVKHRENPTARTENGGELHSERQEDNGRIQ